MLVIHRSEEYSRVDHICKANHLSDLTESSEGRIQYPEQSANKSDYEQRSLLQDLRMKDVLSSRTDWITQGRDPLTIDDHGYTDGDEKFITLEDILTKDPVQCTEGRYCFSLLLL